MVVTTSEYRRRRWFLLGMCLVAVTVPALVFWLWDDGGPPALSPAAGTTGHPESAQRAAASGGVQENSPLERHVVVADATEQPQAELARVRGRCLAAESGQPLAGCTVRFDGRSRGASAMARHGPVQWQDPEPVVTAADGRFEIAFPAMPPFQHSLDVQCQGRAPRTARWGAFEPGQVEDLGDIELQVGFAVRGRVVDTHGNPVPKIGVSVQNLPLPIRIDMAANDSRSGWSDAGGEFVVRVPVPSGTWSLEASGRGGFRHVSPDSVTVDESRGTPPLTVVVQRMPVISGVVVDEQGEPVARVSLSAKLNRSGSIPGAWTRADGTFAMYAVDAAPEPVRIEILLGPCEPMVTERAFEWGTTDARIVVRRGLQFELTVVEQGGGRPVEDYSVQCYPVDARSSSQREVRLGGRHPGGKVTVDRVSRGRNLLVVHPKSQELLVSEVLEFQTTEADGVPPQWVEVEQLRPFRLRVTTTSGDAVEGSTVELIRRGTMPFRVESWTYRVRHQYYGPNKVAQHQLLSKATTDAAGMAQVFVSRDRTELLLRVTGEEHLPTVLHDVLFLEDGTAPTVVVSTGGGLTGQLLLDGIPASEAAVVLVRVDGGSLPSRRDEVEVAVDGAFAVNALPVGEYRLLLGVTRYYRTEHGGSGARVRLEPELGRATVVEGRTAEVKLDASRFRPATIAGKVLLGGAPLSDARVYLQAKNGRVFGQFVPDAGGAFVAEGILPGSYRLGIVVGNYKVARGDRILHDDEFVLQAGARLERTFHFAQRRLVVRVLEADGSTPAANLEVLARAEGWEKRVTTDVAGELVLDPAPSGAIELYPARPGLRKLEPIAMPAGRTEAELEVRLLAAK